jgi:signal transduction histidine kinase
LQKELIEKNNNLSEELVIANEELVFQNEEKEKRAAELVLANAELIFQNEEKEKRAAELAIANAELLYQNNEKEKRAAELVIANAELVFQNEEKEKRAAELAIANAELLYQNKEKEKRAAELVIANAELVFQNEEKEKRAAELVIANAELVYQNEEKEKRAAELVLANAELVFQNADKEKLAAELIIANKELVFQNEEKEKRAAELRIANRELHFQNEEKEKRAIELINANKELLIFTFLSSHDLQEPIRKIITFSKLIEERESRNLSEDGKHYFNRLIAAAQRMQSLMHDLLAYSHINTSERIFEKTDLKDIIEHVKLELKEVIDAKRAVFHVSEICKADIIRQQFQQLMYNVVGNALKFSLPGVAPHITIRTRIVKAKEIVHVKLLKGIEYCHIVVTDQGIGFPKEYSERIFEVFKKLHPDEKYQGTGMGLAIAKKIVENHKGFIIATSGANKGTTVDIYIPSPPGIC